MKACIKKNNVQEAPDDQMSIYDFFISEEDKESIKMLRYCAPSKIFEMLDGCIRDDKQVLYSEIKKRLSELIRISINPFGAGAPSKYDEDDVLEMKKMHREGKSYRDIAEKFHCSISTVSRHLK